MLNLTLIHSHPHFNCCKHTGTSNTSVFQTGTSSFSSDLHLNPELEQTKNIINSNNKTAYRDNSHINHSANW